MSQDVKGLADYRKWKSIGKEHLRGDAGSGRQCRGRCAAAERTGCAGEAIWRAHKAGAARCSQVAVRLAVDTFRRLDVLVNNTDYGQFPSFEPTRMWSNSRELTLSTVYPDSEPISELQALSR
jgi:hypothetical protein